MIEILIRLSNYNRIAMSKLSLVREKAMRDAFLKYPTKSDQAISKIVKISQPTISKYRKEYALSIDSEFIAIVAGKFIQEFGHAIHHWSNLIEELEILKGTKKTIFKQNEKTKGYFTEEVSLDAMEKLQLVKEQANLRARILFLASQGEVREVIKLMRGGQLPQLEVN